MGGPDYTEWDRYRDASTTASQRAFRTMEVRIFDRVRWSLFDLTKWEVRTRNSLIGIAGMALRGVYRRMSSHMGLEIDEVEAIWHGIPEKITEGTINKVRSQNLSPIGTLVGDSQRNILYFGSKKTD